MNISLKSQSKLRQALVEAGLVTDEQLATERAKEKASNLRWDHNVALLSYMVLTAVVILSFKGIAPENVALIAAFGLASVWLVGWRRGKRLFKHFYEQELHQLREHPWGMETEAFTPPPITPREIEILSYIACGDTNKQIAYKFGISEQTIKNHMTSILRKLDANDRTQAVVLAMRSGWISPQATEPSEPTPGDNRVDLSKI